MPKYQAPKGCPDIYRHADEACFDSDMRAFIESELRQTAQRYGFSEIRTPAFEKLEVFTRSSGEGSDIVDKEMYQFKDKGGRDLALRPELTACVARAFIQHRFDLKGVKKLFYIGNCYRYDRPQAGRYREFSQFGIEYLDDASPFSDVESIAMLMHIFENLGLKNLNLQINTIGLDAERAAYSQALREYLKPQREKLSEDSQRRFEENPLRILDSKDPKDKALIENAPILLDYLSDASKERFETVCNLLNRLGIHFTIEPRLVRGLDYYSNTVFEVTTGELGAQNSIAAGGRYDRLIAQLGGPDTPAFGFACGIERLILTLVGQGTKLQVPWRPDVYCISLVEKALPANLLYAQRLRQAGLSVEICTKVRNIKKSLATANQIQARSALMIGEDELSKGMIRIKFLDRHEEIEVSENGLIQALQEKLR